MRLQQAGPPKGVGIRHLHDVQNLADHIFRQGGQRVVELCRFVDNVAQSETARLEDKPRHRASLTKRRQLDVPRRYVTNPPAKVPGLDPRSPLFKHEVITEEYMYS